jgi:hypothetical protein
MRVSRIAKPGLKFHFDYFETKTHDTLKENRFAYKTKQGNLNFNLKHTSLL